MPKDVTAPTRPYASYGHRFVRNPDGENAVSPDLGTSAAGGTLWRSVALVLASGVAGAILYALLHGH